MENASKALIIAGAILISILLITIGIVLINSGNEVVDAGTAGMSSQQIQSFNAQFTAYEGIDKQGSEIRGLWNAVNASNGAHPDHKVTINPASLTDVANFKTTNKYDVKLTYNNDGYVETITVVDS